MPHREHDNGWQAESQSCLPQEPSWQDVLELLADHGFDGLADALQILFNEAMKLERSAVLEAQPYERTPLRRGYANGYKPKTVHTRIGALPLAVPKTRGIEFYPTALERGVRSERALKLAVAEMYLQGVSTRKVTAVMEQLCGLEVTRRRSAGRCKSSMRNSTPGCSDPWVKSPICCWTPAMRRCGWPAAW